MQTPRILVALIGLATLALACDAEPPSISRTVAPVSVSNGWTFTGISYGGYSLQAAQPSATVGADALYVASVDTGVDPVAGLGPNGTSLSNESTGVSIANSSFVDRGVEVGEIIEATFENGDAAKLRFLAVEVGLGAQPDVPYFQMEVKADRRRARWAPLCGVDELGASLWAIALPGAWDQSAGTLTGGSWSSQNGNFSFACQNSSIAKCVELGYGLKTNKDGEVEPTGRLKACVRALRADYCGDGTSWTTNGRMLDMWDGGNTLSRSEPSWTFEAVWNGSGARCVADPRLGYPDESPVLDCLANLHAHDCENRMSAGNQVDLKVPQVATSYAPVQ